MLTRLIIRVVLALMPQRQYEQIAAWAKREGAVLDRHEAFLATVPICTRAERVANIYLGVLVIVLVCSVIHHLLIPPPVSVPWWIV
jgi:hypothetical protein